jgi:hypothetical protein
MATKALIALLGAAMLVGCGGPAKTGGQLGAVPAAAAKEADAKEAAGNEARAKEADGKAGDPKEADAKEADGKAGDAKEADAKDGGAKDTRQLELTAEQVARIGVITTAVQAARYAGTAEGFGVILSHELVAQVAADLHSSTAAARLSDAALARAKGLAGGPGALGADALENAERQQAADSAAVELARRKLTSLLGVDFPFHDGADSELEKLAAGSHKLLRATFSSDSKMTGTPKTLRVSSIDAESGAAWNAHTVWAAPQDPSLPGRSVFAILTDATLTEGARVRAQAEADSGIVGVIIPEPAVVVSEGQYWCYLKKKEGVYQRVAIDTSRPFAEGYFVTEAIAPGQEVVTTAAGSLLARELNSSTEAED